MKNFEVSLTYECLPRSLWSLLSSAINLLPLLTLKSGPCVCYKITLSRSYSPVLSLTLSYYSMLCILLCMQWWCTCATEWVWSSVDNSVKLALSSPLYMDSRNHTQIVRLCPKCCYTPGHLSGSELMYVYRYTHIRMCAYRVSCILDWPQTHYVAQDDLELLILLSLPLNCLLISGLFHHIIFLGCYILLIILLVNFPWDYLCPFSLYTQVPLCPSVPWKHISDSPFLSSWAGSWVLQVCYSLSSLAPHQHLINFIQLYLFTSQSNPSSCAFHRPHPQSADSGLVLFSLLF